MAFQWLEVAFPATVRGSFVSKKWLSVARSGATMALSGSEWRDSGLGIEKKRAWLFSGSKWLFRQRFVDHLFPKSGFQWLGVAQQWLSVAWRDSRFLKTSSGFEWLAVARQVFVAKRTYVS